jgi:hypothetical protein
MSASTATHGRPRRRTETITVSPRRRSERSTPTIRGGHRKLGPIKPAPRANRVRVRAAAANSTVEAEAAVEVMFPSMKKGCDSHRHNPSVVSKPMADSPPTIELSPLQLKTLGLLRRGDDPIVFDADFIAELRADIEAAFVEFHERMNTEKIFMSKHRVSSVLGCEVQHLHDDMFSWSPAVAGGQVAHRAVQLIVNWKGDPVPADVIDEAIARLADDDTSLGDWIAGLSEADAADLRGFAVDKLIKFQECFPPLDRRSAPTVESSVRWPIDGPIVLSGKVDLTLGRPSGSESRKVIIDLKTGWVSQKHREDLRFYALVETLRADVPPRKLASFYLDAGEPVVEDVTENVLRTAARRMLDAVNAEIELRCEGREPTKRPGVSCRWCPLSDNCAEGQAYLEERSNAG